MFNISNEEVSTVAYLVEKLCYEQECCGFGSRCHSTFCIDLIFPASLWPSRSTEPLKEISTTNLPGATKRPAHKADKISAIREPTV
jgi:hypothetical protein